MNLKYILLYSLLFFVILNSCDENVVSDDLTSKLDNNDNNSDLSLPFDERVRNYVERKLNIPTNENYKLKVYENFLNDDTISDYVITVNRFENALKKYAEDKKMVKASQIGFFGDHNFLIYYSSLTKKFSEPIIFGSTPQRELTVSFENISSDKHKDIVVDYPIRNSQFRKVFLIFDDKLQYSFHAVLYDGWGTDKLESYCFEYDTGSYSSIKDIVVKKGNMKNISKNDDYDTITPNIECTDITIRRFFFNSKDRQYYTADVSNLKNN
jgi:hypothetical protein